MAVSRPPAGGYLIAVFATAAVALLRYALSDPIGPHVELVPFVIPVVLAGWYGGLRPGLFATLLGGVVAGYLFLSGAGFSIEPAGALALAVFGLVGITVSWLCDSLLAATRRAEAQSRSIQSQAAELQRTSQDLLARERQLEQALAAGRSGTWEWDVASNRVTWSSTLEEIHGLHPGTFPGTFEAFQQDIHPEDRERIAGAIERQLASGGAYRVEYRIVLADGRIRWLGAQGEMQRDESGAPLRMVGICTDVSDRKHIEAELAEADRRKDEFLATLSHELRNPLAVLWNALEIMRRAPDRSDAMVRARELADRQMTYLTRLIEDLLDIGRISRGQLQLRRERVDIGRVIEDAVEFSRPQAEAAGHQVRVELPPGSIRLDADHLRLAQVVGNLLTNACKYTRNGGRIELTAQQEDGWVVISVRDNGVGITRESLGRVFDLFVRVDRDGGGSGGETAGLGIGLSLARRLVELHGGTIDARSDGLGKGSEFVVRLPTAEYSRASSAG